MGNFPEQVKSIQDQLIKSSITWALRQSYDTGKTRDLRHKAILLNHNLYLKNIPVYLKLVREEGITENPDIAMIKQRLMSTDDIFKSYNPEWLDQADFNHLNRWLSEIFINRVPDIETNLSSPDAWLDWLDNRGIKITYSSGTSGVFSFVPRESASWDQAKTANTCYLAPLITYRKLKNSISGSMLRSASQLLSPDTLVKMIKGQGLPDFDAVFLGFKNGRLGNQRLIQEMSPLFRRQHFLFNIDLNLNILRIRIRGPQNEAEQVLLEKFQTEVIDKKEQHYQKTLDYIETSIRDGQKVFLFGAPYQFKALCYYMSVSGQKKQLNPGSLILFGGGWKELSGEILSRENLVEMLCSSFGIKPEDALEGYSMTEINTLMLRCEAGRFHIPPLIEPVILDEALVPIEGKDIRGVFGFLDPFATSYPGFLITGDRVHLVDEKCECGLAGPALIEIKRVSNREIKGCGGVMGSIKA